jgi:hypothetical protein
MEEIWKDIDGYDDYKISNLGRILFNAVENWKYQYKHYLALPRLSSLSYSY